LVLFCFEAGQSFVKARELSRALLLVLIEKETRDSCRQDANGPNADEDRRQRACALEDQSSCPRTFPVARDPDLEERLR
jgi:hypothetical protein